MAFPQSSRFALFLRRAFSIKETMADVNVLQDFFPTVELIGDVLPDQRRNRGELNFISGFNVPGVAGNLTQAVFGNLPPFSLSVIESMLVQAAAATNLRMGFSVNAPQGGFNQGFVSSVDGREPGATILRNPLQAGATSHNVSDVQSFFFQAFSQPSNNFVFPRLNITIPDSSTDGRVRNLFIETETVAVSFAIIVIGYSRIVEPSERQA